MPQKNYIPSQLTDGLDIRVSHQSAHRTLRSIDLEPPIDVRTIHRQLRERFADNQAVQQRERRAVEGRASPARTEDLDEWSIV